MTAETIRIPELFGNPDDVPLEPDEKAQAITVKTTADGGYRGNHFEVALRTRLSLVGFDKLDLTKEGTDSWFHRAYVNPNDLREYIQSNEADGNIILG